MAITISSASSFHTVRIEYVGTGSGNEVTKTFKLDGTLNDTQIIAFLTALSLTSNAGIVSATVDGRKVNGWPAAVNALQNLVSAIMVLAFTRTNPVNSAKQITHNFVIPAYKDALRLDTGKPDDSDTNVAALISALQSGIVIQGSDGAYYTGSFTYDAGESGFATDDAQNLPG